MTRKTLLIIGAVLTLLIIGVIIYFAYFREEPTPKEPSFPIQQFPIEPGLPGFEVPPEKLPAVEQKGGILRVLVEEPTIGPTLSREGTAVVYLTRENGNVYRINFDGADRSRISNVTIIGIYHAHWSPDKTKVFLSYERNDEIKKLILDLAGENPSSTIVPTSVRSGTWSSDGKTFYSLEETLEGVRLLAGDANNKNGRERLKIPLGDLTVLQYPDSSLFFTEAPSGLVRGPLFEFNTKNGVFQELLSGFGIIALPSPKNSKILISQTLSGGKLLNLRIFTRADGKESSITAYTLSEKCGWANEDILFCGVPRNPVSQTLMPDNYYKGLIEMNDALVRIDTLDLSVTMYEAEGFDRGLDIQDVLVDPAGQYVFFRDQKTDFLYSFLLPKQ